MEKIWDKIFLVAALVVTGGSAAYFMTVAEKTDSAPPDTGSLLGGEYEPLDRPTVEKMEVAFEEPVAAKEDENAIYDTFTPPKIFWNMKEKKLVWQAVGPMLRPDLVPFALKLEKIERELFRIQLEAYFVTDPANVGAAALHFFLPKSKTTLSNVKAGDRFPEHSFAVKEFRLELDQREDGTFFKKPIVVIEDFDSGQDVELSSDVRLYVPNSYEIHLRVTETYTPEKLLWTEIGDERTFPRVNEDIGQATYTLKDFSFEEQTSTIERKFPENPDYDLEKVLQVEEETAPVEPESETVEASEDSGTSGISAGDIDLF